MPAPTTNDELLDLVRKSGVIDEKRLASQLDRINAAGQVPPEPNRFAGVLVRDGVLTHFQAEQFLQGKWRRFTIGKYKVLERLGVGGMGSVYLCEHTLMRRRVAVKVLPASRAEDSSSLDRFYREARAVAALDHPNIVRAYDIDQDDKLHFLVMEHVDGASLQEIIKKVGPMDPIRAAHYIQQAAFGLQHAHDVAGLVHRDIKPGNILVDRNGIVKVLDMGLARFFHDEEDQLTKQYDENVLGTADYLAPEQAIDSHTATIRADIYSLGGTLYWCLSGRTPFTEGSIAQKLIWHQTRQPKPIRTYRNDIPEGIIAVLEKMMAKQPENRYQTPQEVADALAPWTQTPIPPPPDKEMPTFSLAATVSLKPGEASMTAARAAAAEAGPGKNWHVNGTAPTTTNSTAPTPPIAPRLPPPPSPRPAPVAPAPIASPRPTQAPPPMPVRPAAPAPRPVAPPRLEQAVAVPTPQPVRAALAPATATTKSSPRVGAVEMATAQAAPPTPLVEPEVESPEESEAYVIPTPVRRPTRKRPSVADQIREKGKLPLLIGIAGGVVVVAAAFLVYFLVFAAPTSTPDPKPQRATFRVLGNSPGALEMALRQAKDGDLILLEGDVKEANVHIKVPNLTIEASSGRSVTWYYPSAGSPGSTMLLVDNVGGFQLRGITLDGGTKAKALLSFWGKCHGTHLEKLQLKNATKFGLVFSNCEGTAAAPVRLTDVKITTTAATESAIRFDFLSTLQSAPKVNSYFNLRQVEFFGPGRKATTRDPKFVQPMTIDLPTGDSIETVP